MINWVEHLILRRICKGDDTSTRLLVDLRLEHFSQETYRLAAKRLFKYYMKKSRILTWQELIVDGAIPDKVRNKLRAAETRRMGLKRRDPTLVLPYHYENCRELVERMVANAQRSSLIDLQNKMTDYLQKEIGTVDDIRGIVRLLQGDVDKISALHSPSTRVFSLQGLDVESYYDTLASSLKRLFLPTGFKIFDSRNVGMPKDSMWLITSNTGGGKSTLALQTGINVCRQGGRAILVSAEMSHDENIIRLISNLIGVSNVEIAADPFLYKKRAIRALKKFRGETDSAAAFDLYIPDADDDIVKVLTYLHPFQYDMILVDYINLLAPLHKDQWRSLDMSGRYAKLFATNTLTTVALLAQWDAEADHVRYSRALEEHASNSWQWKISNEELRTVGILEIKQRKARNQNPFPFKLRIQPEFSKITDYIESEDEDEATKPLAEGFDQIDKDV